MITAIMIIIATISIFLIVGVVLVIRKIWPSFRVCPICVGVAGTWLWILIGIYLGWLEADSWKLVAALAMGGSVVGIAYRLEKKIRSRKIMAWKILFIPTGFLLVYNLIYFSWVYLALLSIIIFLLFFIFLDPFVFNKRHVIRSDNVKEIEEKMKNCC